MSNKSKAKPEVMTSKKMSSQRDVSVNALEEITLIKDHGFNKKGEKLLRHPNTADMLKEAGIAK